MQQKPYTHDTSPKFTIMGSNFTTVGAVLCAQLIAPLVGCQDNFEKDGMEITPTEPSGEPSGEPSTEVQEQIDDPNDDYDRDGYTENDGDCNDNNARIHPGQAEEYYNDIDENCDGLSDFDADMDGYLSSDWGGNDCDDDNATIHPQAFEDPTDGIDSNCDGQEDPRFSMEIVDANTLLCNGSNAMDVDNTNRVHVVYEDDGQLWYSNKASPSAAWRTPTLIKFDDRFTLGSHGLDGVIDSANRFHIAYSALDTNRNVSLQYAYMPTVGNWVGQFEIDGQSTTRSTSVGHFIDIDIGPDKIPTFGYYNQSAERPYVTKISAVPSTASTQLSFLYRYEADYLVYNLSGRPTGTHTALTVDSSNKAHLVFMDESAPYGTGSAPESQYSAYTNQGDYCESQTMAKPGGYWHSSAMRPDGKLCVAYQDNTEFNLKYACQTNVGNCSSWTIQTIDANYGTGVYAALAFNSQSLPYIAYYDSAMGSLNIASQRGANWELYTIDDRNNIDVGRFINIAIDSLDRVHLTYQNASDKTIWYAIGR